MTDPAQPQPNPTTWKRQYTIAIFLLLGFTVFVVAMVYLADNASDLVWQRRVYLFSAVEAIVFTAVGWIFGREVHRSTAETARQDATEARQNETAARDAAQQSAAQAAEASERAAAERARGETVAAVIANTQPAGPQDEEAARPGPMGRSQEASGRGDRRSGPAGGAVVDLHGLMRDLYGPDRLAR